MNILIFNGSPRKNGNTARLVEAFAKGAGESGHPVKTEMVALQNISGCRACEYCHRQEQGVCIQKDDMQGIYREIMWADMLVFASPIYYYTMTGQFINTIDRTYALGQLKHLKKTALILSSGAPAMYDAAITQYKGVVSWWSAKDAGIFTFPGMTRSHALENVSKENMEEIY